MVKNKIFVNKINKKVGNNQLYSDVSLEKENEIIEEKLTVKDKIDNLLKRNGYIFNVDVEIITNDERFNTKIAAVVNNHVITLDNNVIDINSIKDIIIKN